MIANVRARFSNGILTPLEPLDIKEGAEVTLSVIEIEANSQTHLNQQQPDEDSPPSSGTHPVIAMIDRLRADIPELEMEKAPPDGAKNYKHYLYGFPKEE